MMRVKEIPMLEDNYGYLVVDDATNQAAAIDPVEPDKVLAAASKAGALITHILTTHKHWDHAGGNSEMRKLLPDVPVLGGAGDGVAACTWQVQEGEVFRIGRDLRVECLLTPGHTMGHMCYAVTDERGPEERAQRAVFTGDTLFVGGAGKFFEGSPADMLASLSKLGALPPETFVYCGHEYTLQNYAFARWLDPDNPDLAKAAAAAQAQRAEGLPTVPSTIAVELATNPFMRASALQERVVAQAGSDLRDLSTASVLGKIREMKNEFK